MSLDAFTIYMDDYDGGTRGWKAAEHGAYFQLMKELYRNYGTIDFEPKRLRMIAGLPEARDWRKVWAKIQHKFVVKGNVRTNKDGVILAGDYIFCPAVDKRLNRIGGKVKAKTTQKRHENDIKTTAKRPPYSEKTNENNEPPPFSRARASNLRLNSVDDALGNHDWKGILEACLDAADPCLNQAAKPLMNFSKIRHWIEADIPCDLERDIIPTIKRLAMRNKKRDVRSWNYFERAVFQARDERIATTSTKVHTSSHEGKGHERTNHDGQKQSGDGISPNADDWENSVSRVLAVRKARRLSSTNNET